MALRLSGDGVGYGCSTHGYGVFLSSCEECSALNYLCRMYGVTQWELQEAITQIKNDTQKEKEEDKTSGLWYNGF